MTRALPAQIAINARRGYLRTAIRVAHDDPAWMHSLIAAAEAGDQVYLRPFTLRLCKLALRRAGAGYQKEKSQ